MTASDEAVCRLMAADPEVRPAKGFAMALRDAIRASLDEDSGGVFLEIWREHIRERSKFIPDAYKLDHKTKTVYCYEVEDSNPISLYKLGRIGQLSNLTYEFYWDIEMICLDIDLNERHRFSGMLPYLYELPTSDSRTAVRQWIREHAAIAAGRHPELLIGEMVGARIMDEDAALATLC